MSRDPRAPVRRQASQRHDPRYQQRRWRLNPSSILAVLGTLALIILVPVLVLGALGPLPGPAVPASPTNGVSTTSPATSNRPRASTPAPTGEETPSGVAPSPSESPTAAVSDVPLVPVIGFWETDTAITTEELVDALEGKSDDYDTVVIAAGTRRALGDQLGITVADSVTDGDAAAIRAAVKDGALGVLRATEVTPAVRALAIGDASLFGNDRAASVDEWPLVVKSSPGGKAWDQTRTWTIAAGGDILLDRGVAKTVTVNGKGVDYPWEGGRVEITGYSCCSGFGHKVPRWERTGGEGAVKALFSGADIAMANLESAATPRFEYHTSGFAFTGDPKFLDGIKRAGIDFLSLANNHIHNAGKKGILETREETLARGFAISGAGKDLAEAGAPAEFQVAGGIKVAVIGCDQIAYNGWADEESTGSNPCDPGTLVPQIRDAEERADVVVIFPHWGREYRNKPTAGQRSDAREWIEAGADLVLGNHAHWTAGIEEMEGKLVFYALGNLVFDQDWSEMTMQGAIVELTYHGTELVQARIHPTLVVDDAQPNLLDPAGDGQLILDRMQDGSTRLDW
jgi:poly-gamma-glutamate synthesis protein (capsule biosynthesis protein)